MEIDLFDILSSKLSLLLLLSLAWKCVRQKRSSMKKKEIPMENVKCTKSFE